MKGRLNKVLCLALCMLMAAGCFAGCGQKQAEAPAPTAAPAAPKYAEAYLTKIPIKAEVYAENANKGTVETLSYETHAYAVEELKGLQDQMLTKELLVYLPYGYDAAKQYNVLYLMHGGGENQTYWIGDNPKGNSTRNLLDNMVANGLCEDTIVVTPTYESAVAGIEDEALFEEYTNWFWKELRGEIIPLVETTYSTYTKGDVSEQNLIATRDHRAFAGFSMGSITTIHSAMMHCTDIMSYFGSYSGAKTDAKALEAALTGEFADYPIKYWYNGNGSADIAHDEHLELYETILKDLPDRFVDGENCCWVEFRSGTHSFNCWLPELYNCLLVFFKK